MAFQGIPNYKQYVAQLQNPGGGGSSIVDGISQLLNGLGVAFSSKRKVELKDDDMGHTIGAFMSVLMGGAAHNPVRSIHADGTIKTFLGSQVNLSQPMTTQNQPAQPQAPK